MTDAELLDEIKRLDKANLTPAEAARVMHCDPDLIRVAARQKPELLGFPTVVVGTRTKIPRIPFLRYYGVDV